MFLHSRIKRTIHINDNDKLVSHEKRINSLNGAFLRAIKKERLLPMPRFPKRNEVDPAKRSNENIPIPSGPRVRALIIPPTMLSIRTRTRMVMVLSVSVV